MYIEILIFVFGGLCLSGLAIKNCLEKRSEYQMNYPISTVNTNNTDRHTNYYTPYTPYTIYTTETGIIDNQYLYTNSIPDTEIINNHLSPLSPPPYEP